MYVKLFAKQLDLEATHNYEPPEDCQELMPKHVGAIIDQ
jgi:hypothetical protein